MTRIEEVAAALAAVEQSLADVTAEHQKYADERAGHERALSDAEAVVREHALSAKRGDAGAQRKVDAAIGQMRDSDAAHRLLTAAMTELQDERKEFEKQREVLQKEKVRAERADVAEQKLTLAKQLDAECQRLSDRMLQFAKLDMRIQHLNHQLGESGGRELHTVWAQLFGNFFHTAAPFLFPLIAPSQKPFATFEAVSRRFTSEDPHAQAEGEAAAQEKVHED